MKFTNYYMSNLSFSRKCPICTDVSNISYEETCTHLNYCHKCNKFFQCTRVKELNDRLVATENLDS